jgi:hypothetical protein
MMSRHTRLQRSVRSPHRHGKIRGNRIAREYRRTMAFLDALDRGWLPGELVPYTSLQGEIIWLDFGAPSPVDVAYARRRMTVLSRRLASRGLATAR